MPRVMLRYALEHLTKPQRAHYLGPGQLHLNSLLASQGKIVGIPFLPEDCLGRDVAWAVGQQFRQADGSTG
jgi:hypothetical protein